MALLNGANERLDCRSEAGMTEGGVGRAFDFRAALYL